MGSFEADGGLIDGGAHDRARNRLLRLLGVIGSIRLAIAAVEEGKEKSRLSGQAWANYDDRTVSTVDSIGSCLIMGVPKDEIAHEHCAERVMRYAGVRARKRAKTSEAHIRLVGCVVLSY